MLDEQVTALTKQLTDLTAMMVQLQSDNAELKNDNALLREALLREENEYLKRKLFGIWSEKSNTPGIDQLSFLMKQNSFVTRNY